MLHTKRKAKWVGVVGHRVLSSGCMGPVGVNQCCANFARQGFAGIVYFAGAGVLSAIFGGDLFRIGMFLFQRLTSMGIMFTTRTVVSG